MNLAIDIGNTRTKIAVFDKDKAVASITAEAIQEKQLDHLFRRHAVKNCILSAVSSYHGGVNDFISKKSHLIILDSKTPLPIKNLYKTPLTLGKDRIAAAAGAYSLYPGENTLVLDVGTAITCEFINSSGEYLGGGISPGIGLRFKALNAYTDNLPLIEAEHIGFLIGKSTKESILSGVMNGTRMELDGIIGEYSKEHGNLRVLMTGGDAAFFETTLKSKIFVIPNLVLIGLNKILQHNVALR